MENVPKTTKLHFMAQDQQTHVKGQRSTHLSLCSQLQLSVPVAIIFAVQCIS